MFGEYLRENINFQEYIFKIIFRISSFNVYKLGMISKRIRKQLDCWDKSISVPTLNQHALPNLLFS